MTLVKEQENDVGANSDAWQKSDCKWKNSSFVLSQLSNGFTKLDSFEHTDIAK